jgi:glycosyltransferase involved in cell wall biosynthesis
MNVFVIPSWFPHRCFPLEGIFLHDQAVALGEVNPGWNVAISLWNQGTGRLSLEHFRRSPLCLRDAFVTRPFERAIAPNVVEYSTPALTWSEAWAHGNRDGVLRANRQNLVRAIARFGRIDMLHAHVSYPAGWVAMRLSEERRIPYVITEHMGPFPLPVYTRPDGQLPAFIREPLEHAHARIAVSPALCERIAGFGIPKPAYVPNLVDERCYRPVPRAARERFVFFTLCQMEQVKGIPDLLLAIRGFLDQLSEADRARVEWRFGGRGTQYDVFRARAGELGLDPWVTWFGFMSREDARREYGACDVFVLASHHESFGIVVVEAAAFGKPVIATRSGGPEATITPETGVLVAPRRPDELATAMLSLFRGERVFDAARIAESFASRYSRPAVVAGIEREFAEASAAFARLPGQS